MTLGFSPCPNDTFIFDAIVNQKIDTENLEFDLLLADVEELNKKANKKELDVTKLSFHALCYLSDDYHLLNSGSALGTNCGPLLICKNPLDKTHLQNAKIAIPGEQTTANFLLNYFAPQATNKTAILFSDIENALLTGEYDAGVIIHENRFTYQEKGLQLIQDLGEYWEKQTEFPIPLGGIAVRREFSLEKKQKINRVLKRSIEYAFRNKKPISSFIVENAQEMEEQIIEQHIDLYVNKFTLDLGEKGRNAVRFMMQNIQPTKEITIIQ